MHVLIRLKSRGTREVYGPTSLVVSNDHVSRRASIECYLPATKMGRCQRGEEAFNAAEECLVQSATLHRITPLSGALTARCVKRHALLPTYYSGQSETQGQQDGQSGIRSIAGVHSRIAYARSARLALIIGDLLWQRVRDYVSRYLEHKDA